MLPQILAVSHDFEEDIPEVIQSRKKEYDKFLADFDEFVQEHRPDIGFQEGDFVSFRIAGNLRYYRNVRIVSIKYRPFMNPYGLFKRHIVVVRPLNRYFKHYQKGDRQVNEAQYELLPPAAVILLSSKYRPTHKEYKRFIKMEPINLMQWDGKKSTKLYFNRSLHGDL